MKVVLAAAGLVAALAGIAIAVWPQRPPATDATRVAAGAGVPPLPAAVAATAPDQPVVCWSADTRARFEPCGCVAGMFGGLSRRAPLLARLPAGQVLSLELGGWSAGPADHQRIRTGFYLRGLAAAGIDAVGVGRAEAALGRTALAAHIAEAASAGVPVVCANLAPRAGGTLAQPWVEVVAAGRRFAVTAVLPGDAAGDDLVAAPPGDALAALRPALGGLPLVVMADLDEEGLAALARAVPDAALIVGGAVGGPTPEPLAIGAVRVVHVANHGKTVGWWPWGASACAFELVPDRLPEDPAQRALVRAYQERLGRERLAIDAGGMTDLQGGAWAGTATCTACHAEAARVHAASGHARAHAALVGRGYQDDPDCLRCHVTGLGRAGGFARATAADWQNAVSCESCHGPAAAHVAAAARGTPRAAPLPPVTLATCLGCHDAENSPAFAWEVYAPRIRHWAERAR